MTEAVFGESYEPFKFGLRIYVASASRAVDGLRETFEFLQVATADNDFRALFGEP